MRQFLQITSLAFVMLADLNGWGLLHCKVPPLLNGTGHLCDRTGRGGTGSGGAGAGVGGEKGEEAVHPWPAHCSCSTSVPLTLAQLTTWND